MYNTHTYTYKQTCGFPETHTVQWHVWFKCTDAFLGNRWAVCYATPRSTQCLCKPERWDRPFYRWYEALRGRLPPDWALCPSREPLSCSPFIHPVGPATGYSSPNITPRPPWIAALKNYNWSGFMSARGDAARETDRLACRRLLGRKLCVYCAVYCGVVCRPTCVSPWKP